MQVTTLEGRIVWSIAMSAKHGVGPFRCTGPAGSALHDPGFGLLGQPGGPVDSVGVNILPDNGALRRDFKEAAGSTLADQRVAVG